MSGWFDLQSEELEPPFSMIPIIFCYIRASFEAHRVLKIKLPGKNWFKHHHTFHNVSQFWRRWLKFMNHETPYLTNLNLFGNFGPILLPCRFDKVRQYWTINQDINGSYSIMISDFLHSAFFCILRALSHNFHHISVFGGQYEALKTLKYDLRKYKLIHRSPHSWFSQWFQWLI